MEKDMDKLHTLWDVEQDILDVLDRICREHGLRYSLAYGTLLGAIRHEGFIPWDDDIDIIMPREDYDRLIALWDTAGPEGYIMETEESGGDDYCNNFAKVKKDHTAFLESEKERSSAYHKGIFVDIFPGDRRAPGCLGRCVQFALFAVSLLYNRGYLSGSHGPLVWGERILLALVPRRHYRRLSIDTGLRSRRWNGRKDLKMVFPHTINACRIDYPPDVFENLEEHPFRGKSYFVMNCFDTVLRLEYGDYTQLPPEKDRVWKHHPILVDFERNYEEICAEEGQ